MRRILLILGLAALCVAVLPLGSCTPAFSQTGNVPSWGRVVGSVINATNSLPISGAVVVVGGVSTTTTGDGTFSIARVPAGDKTYSVTATGFQAIRDQHIAVAANGEAQLNVFLVPAATTGGTVRGKVTDALTTLPLDQVTVQIGALQVSTGGDGVYALTGVPQGPQTVTFTRHGYQTQSRSVSVDVGGVYDINAALAAVTWGTLMGTVSDPATGRGLAGVVVSIDATLTTTTDTSGRYTLDQIPEGTPVVHYALTGYRAAERTVSIQAGITSVQDVQLLAPAQGSLTGTVRNRVSGAKLGAVSVSITEMERSVTTSSDPATLGTYTFPGVPAGTYTLVFTLTDYATFTIADVVIQGGQTAIEDAQLEPTTGSIVGRVYEQTDPTTITLLPNATVRVGSQGTQLTTDANGYYAVDGLPAGLDGTTYVVYAWDATHQLGSMEVVVLPGMVVSVDNLILNRVP